MSNKCPHCGAEAGKFHVCPYAPGGKYYKAPAQKKPLPKTVEVVEEAASKPALAREPQPNWSWQQDAKPEGPTSRKRRTDPVVQDAAEQAAQKKAAKVARQANREGKKPAMAWLDDETATALKIAAAKHKTTQEAIVAEGIAVMLGGKYKI